jgi:hypothetical protein
MRGSNRRKTFATEAAAIAQDGPAAFGGFAGAESVLPLAADFGRLILSFHKFNFVCAPAPNEQRSIAIKRQVSRQQSAIYAMAR